MAINTFRIATDFAGHNGLIRNLPSYVNAVVVAANTAEDITIPAGADIVLFSATADFYVKANAAATVPVDTTNGSAAELNPTGYELFPLAGVAITQLSVISATANAIITAAFYKLQKTTT